MKKNIFKTSSFAWGTCRTTSQEKHCSLKHHDGPWIGKLSMGITRDEVRSGINKRSHCSLWECSEKGWAWAEGASGGDRKTLTVFARYCVVQYSTFSAGLRLAGAGEVKEIPLLNAALSEIAIFFFSISILLAGSHYMGRPAHSIK